MEFNWTQEIWGNSLSSYAIVGGVTLMTALVARIVLAITQWRLSQVAKPEKKLLWIGYRALEKTNIGYLFLFTLSLVLNQLELPEKAYPWLQTSSVLFVTLQILAWINAGLSVSVNRYTHDDLSTMGARETTMKMVFFFVRIFLYTFAALVVVDNIPGVNITALVASLGVGGIAIALALQNILSDIFASLTITLDKPFVIGDFIIVGDLLGVVENIGLKTTRIRSLSGEQLIFSNNDLLTSRIRNYKRMRERRVPFTIGVTYDTPAEKLRKIPAKAKEIIESLDDVRFDRAHFKAHSDYSLDFEIVYYVLGADYNLYMDRQQAINLALHEYFAEQGIEFAFPTQTLYHRSDDAKIDKALETLPILEPKSVAS